MQTRELTEYKRHWKGLIQDYDYLSDQDNENEYMVCLTELELQILLAAVAPYKWKTRYFSDTTEVNQDVIDTWVDGLILELMGYCMPCADFSISIDVSYVQYINTLIQQYDGTPSSVNENAPDDYFSDGEARERALCMALNSWVKSYINAWLRKAQMVLALGIIGLFLFAVPVLGWVAVILIGGLAFVTQTYYDALSDEEAIEAVICCWYENLIGQIISKANWASNLALCEFELGSNEQLVLDVLQSETGYDRQWVSFLDALGNAWPLAQAGVDDCPCTECVTEWTHEFLGGEDDASFWVFSFLGYEYGQYNAGNDRFEGTNRIISGAWDYWDLIARLDFPSDIQITRVKFNFAWNSTSTPPTIELASITAGLDGDYTVVKRYPGTSPSSGSAEIDTGEMCRILDQIIVRSTAYHPDGVMTGHTWITSITIEGVGTDPFI